jgi:BirA family biotin operon repressor/biotin-[acetyl-CoA-carboxylase] ligase
MDTQYVTRLEDRVHSTQDLARSLFEAGTGVPVLAIAHKQDGGRGRMNNIWWSSPRAMMASLAMTHAASAGVTLAPLVAGLAAHDAIDSQLGLQTALKWPNDIIIDDAKVGGILAELTGDTLVVGCGINLWWPEAPAGAVGLLEHDPGKAAAVELAHDWATRLVRAINGLPASFNKARYTEICSTIGRHITWQPDGAGRAVGITVDGGLIVDTAAEQVTIRSGEVSHVRAATIVPSETK